jgi:hypothetical protein
MRRRNFMISLMALATALPLAGCFDGESVSRRIKLIATAEVDGKQVQGSTVIELTWRASGPRMYESEKGEALILELAGRGTVYVLSRAHYKNGNINAGIVGILVNKSMGLKWPATARREEFPIIREAAGRFTIRPLDDQNSFPLMVAFKDESRKDSIYEVRPDEFAKHFGADVKFVGLEFEFTDEPITDALKKRLPMLEERNQSNVFPRDPDGQTTRYSKRPFPKKMSENMFFSFGEI